MKIKYICETVEWRDKVNGNTYHTCRITRTRDGKTIASKFTYGYGNHYRQTAITYMVHCKWIPTKYKETPFLFERENDYPIYWTTRQGLKRECLDNSVIC